LTHYNAAMIHTSEIETADTTYAVEWEYLPGSPRTWDDPGCDPEVSIISVVVDGHPVVLSVKLVDKLECRIWSLIDGKREAAAEARADAFAEVGAE
jgi:hypothetical protein